MVTSLPARGPGVCSWCILAHFRAGFNTLLDWTGQIVTMEGRECRSGKNVIHGGRVGAGTADFTGAPMLSCRSRFRPAGPVGAVLTILTLALAADTGRAQHIVYLKDGTVLHGRIFSQREQISDGGLNFTVFKAGSFFAVGDGARAMIFPVRNID